MEHELCEGCRTDRNFEVNSVNPLLPHLTQIEVEPREFIRHRHFKFQLLPQFSDQRLLRIFSAIYRATKTSPMTRVEDAGQRVSQLHYVTAVVEYQDCSDGIGRGKRAGSGDEGFVAQELPKINDGQARRT